jgi:hypothetical protein
VSAATALMWMASPGKGWGRQCGSTSACSCGWVAPGHSTGGHELWHPWDAATPTLRCPPPAQVQPGERVTESPCCRRLCPSFHPRCALQTTYTPTTPHQPSLPAKLQSKPTCSQPRAFTRVHSGNSHTAAAQVGAIHGTVQSSCLDGVGACTHRRAQPPPADQAPPQPLTHDQRSSRCTAGSL